MSNYLIDFSKSTTDNEISQYFAAQNCTIVKTFSRLDKVYLVSSPAVPVKTDIVEYVVLDDDQAFKLHEVLTPTGTQPTDTRTLTINDNPNWWKVYSLQDVNFENPTVDIPIYGKGFDVYLVDSGINKDHTEFLNKDVVLLHSVNGDFTDVSGHGTALGSLIIGQTCGMTDATLKVVKLFDATSATLQSDFILALDAILTDYITSGVGSAVVNMSWSINKNAFIESKIQSLIDLGMAVVVAAGNSGIPIEDVTPASMAGVCTVGSYGQNFIPSAFSDYTDPTITSLTAGASNHGALDCWAPGEQIWAANVAGGYGFIAGTSASAAIVSAALAYNISKSWVSPATNKVYSYLKDNDGKIILDYLVSSTRKNLLNLSDAKYATSKNEIITFYNKIEKETQYYVTPQKLVSRVGQRTGILFAWPDRVKSYEFLGALPAGVFMEDSFMYFTATEEPTEPSGVHIYEIGYRFTDIYDNVEESTLSFVTLATDFDSTTLPASDPLIDIIVQLVNCATTGACNASCAGGKCKNQTKTLSCHLC